MASKRIITIGLLLVVPVALIGLAILGVRHHRVPEKLALTVPLIICGHTIHMPAEVRYVMGLQDGGSMIFAIKDDSRKVYSIVCMFGPGSADRFAALKFCEGLPIYDGTTDPVLSDITDNRDEVRNFLYYAMKDAGFHGSSVERAMAHQLYPNLFQRYVR